MRARPRAERDLGAGSMADAFRASLLQTAQRGRTRRFRRMRTACALAGVAAGIAFSAAAYAWTSSLALAVFALVLTVVTIAGGLSAVLVGPGKARWAAYHAVMPVVAVGALASAQAFWHRWSLSVVVALSVWFLVGGTLAFALLPKPPVRRAARTRA